MKNEFSIAVETLISRINLTMVLEKALYCVAVVAFAMIITKIIRGLIKRATKNKDRAGRRGVTLVKLLNSTVFYIIWFFALLEIVKVVFNVNPTSIFAAAGVAGVALGFGAQNLVKDIIGGFFLMFENLMSVGDLVTVGDTTGTVIEIGMRSTKLKTHTGDFFVIPNGDVTKLVNHSRFDRCVVCDIEIDRKAPLDMALSVLSGVCENAKNDLGALLERPEIQGVTNIAEGKATLRVICKTRAGDQFAVEREMLARIREEFRARGVKTPVGRIEIMPDGSRK